ncbi:MAG: hypothetical protein HY874_11595 [Chloroflexi bacterium]|nr:hypothetical protein [Chloroflexota bacterium]
MAIEPVSGQPARFPPGRVVIRLGEEHRRAYRTLYGHYRTVIDGLPVLRERDFDGRAVRVTAAQLAALNRAFAALPEPGEARGTSAFSAQEQAKNRLFKRLQYLS